MILQSVLFVAVWLAATSRYPPVAAGELGSHSALGDRHLRSLLSAQTTECVNRGGRAVGSKCVCKHGCIGLGCKRGRKSSTLGLVVEGFNLQNSGNCSCITQPSSDYYDRGPPPPPLAARAKNPKSEPGQPVAAPADTRSRCGALRDNSSYVNAMGDGCRGWVGHAPCLAVDQYTDAELRIVRHNCPFTCGGCDHPAPTRPATLPRSPASLRRKNLRERAWAFEDLTPGVDCPYWRRGRTMDPLQLQEKSLGNWDAFNEDRLTDRVSLIDRFPSKGEILCHPETPPGPGEPPEHWFLEMPVREPRKNHDGLLLHMHPNGSLAMPGAGGADGLVYVDVLGRNSRTMEVTDLITGEQTSYFGREDLDTPRITTGRLYLKAHIKTQRNPPLDPTGRNHMNDINHVATVTVPKLDGSGIEIWVPCGFHGDEANQEISTMYARIIDGTTFESRSGPKLPQSGGACGAAPIEVDGPGTPPHICAFGGTDGTHDAGLFLKTINCYDRVKQAWGRPFADLPRGMDHVSLTRIPAGACAATDPEKLLITNFRTTHYGGHDDTMYTYELPPAPGKQWTLWAEPNGEGRDAAGMTTANNGRQLLMFGGVRYLYPFNEELNKTIRIMTSSPESQVFDTCNRTGQWRHKSELGTPLYAMQVVSSARLNLVLHCGGTGHEYNDHGYEWKKWAGGTQFRYCIATRFPADFQVGDRHIASALGVVNGHASYTLPLTAYHGAPGDSAPARRSAEPVRSPSCLPGLQLNPTGGASLRMPAMGIGTCCRPSANGDPLVESLGFFLAAGGRLIDTAQSYQNHRDVGRAIKIFVAGGGRRDELWITTKIDTKRDEGGRDGVLRSVDKALGELGLNSLDMVLLHHPQCRVRVGDPVFATEEACVRSSWAGLVEAQRLGKARAIGVSNFNTSQLAALLDGEAPAGDAAGAATAVVVPAVNQLEVNPWYKASAGVLRDCAARGIAVSAFNSLGGSARLSGQVAVRTEARIDAMAQARSLTKPQLLLRWALDEGLAVVPGATSKAHIEENLVTCTAVPLGPAERAALVEAPKPANFWDRATLGKIKHE